MTYDALTSWDNSSPRPQAPAWEREQNRKHHNIITSKLCLTIIGGIMRSRYKIFETEAPYFITSTTVEWLPLFTSMPYFEILRSSLRFSQREKQLKIYAFVFMDNHFHAIMQHPQLSRIMQSIKSYTAFEMIKQLKADKKVWALNVLQNYKLPHKTESRYQVWQEGFHPQLITDDDMLTQKIEYLHWNPVKRGFVDTPEAWRYSSARNFAGEGGVVAVDSLELMV